MAKKTDGTALPVQYVGNGAFVPGVPTVDMSLTDWLELPENLRKTALENGLYQIAEA